MKHNILSHLPGDFPWQVHWFDTIDSTNNQAKRIASQGAPHGTVLIAAEQTGGRGRMGRSFSSLAGKGLYLSVILRPECTAEKLMHLTCAAGVAACDAIDATTGYRPKIKWINDLIADGKKLGGILTELSVNTNTKLTEYAIIGIGINCTQKQDDFPEDIRNIAISLETVTGKPVQIHKLAATLIRMLHKMDRDLLAAQQSIMDAYRKDCITLGQDVTWQQNGTQFYGTACDIDCSGALIVKTADGCVQTIHSGEVSIRRTTGYV